MSEGLKIAIIGGIRPHYIKMAALLNNIRSYNQTSKIKFHTICINTRQHYDKSLSIKLCQELNLSFDFEIFHKNMHPDAIVANSFFELSHYLRELTFYPEWILVFGDGNAAMVAAIASVRQGYKIVHVEAGEKRGKYEHEEINRRIIDSLADIYFCVSRRAVSNLAKDGITNNVYWTGDLAYDFTLKCAESQSSGIFGIEEGAYILATIHRVENLEEKILNNIVTALCEMSRKTVFICHPQTKHHLKKFGLLENGYIRYIDALSYFKVLSAIKGCAYLITDSGGIIREASHLGKRCVVRRNAGAWPEFIELGYNLKVGTSLADIRDGLVRMEKFFDLYVPPPQLLYRKNAANYALDLLCDISKSQSLNSKINKNI